MGASNRRSVFNGTTPTEEERRNANESYHQLNEKLKFPNNPAYFKAKKQSRTKPQTKENQTFLDYCREYNIPFNDADALLYKL